MINFAHRGYSGLYPENTMKAFKKAIKVGATGIELDVHKTKDNKLVVIHDEKVDRVFLGRGYVKDYTLKQIQKLKCRKLKYRFDRECYIPTLEEVLILIKDLNIVLNIEIKNNNIYYENIEKDVIDLVNKYDMIKNVIISSFNHESLLICKEINSKIETGLLYSKMIPDIISYSEKFKVDALHPSLFLVNEEYIQNAHKKGLKVNVYTVNYYELMIQLNKWNIDGIITNYPNLMNKL